MLRAILFIMFVDIIMQLDLTRLQIRTTIVWVRTASTYLTTIQQLILYLTLLTTFKHTYKRLLNILSHGFWILLKYFLLVNLWSKCTLFLFFICLYLSFWNYLFIRLTLHFSQVIKLFVLFLSKLVILTIRTHHWTIFIVINDNWFEGTLL
jgi:hypothetical protein